MSVLVNSSVKGGGTPKGWEAIETISIWNNSSVVTSPFEIDIPPNVTSLYSMFAKSNWYYTNLVIHKKSGKKITNLQYLCRYTTNANRKVTLDFDTSGVTNFSNFFDRNGLSSAYHGNLQIIGDLDFSSATAVGGMFTSWVYNSNSQVSMSLVTGTLSVSWNISNINLTDNTLASIVAGLKDMTGETAPTLTLNTNVKARLTEEQIAEITSKNWTLA